MSEYIMPNSVKPLYYLILMPGKTDFAITTHCFKVLKYICVGSWRTAEFLSIKSGVSVNTIRNWLTILVRLGLVNRAYPNGKSKSAIYRYSRFLTIYPIFTVPENKIFSFDNGGIIFHNGNFKYLSPNAFNLTKYMTDSKKTITIRQSNGFKIEGQLPEHLSHLSKINAYKWVIELLKLGVVMSTNGDLQTYQISSRYRIVNSRGMFSE